MDGRYHSPSVYKRLAKAAMKGHFIRLMPVSALALAACLRPAGSVWLILLSLALTLLRPVLVFHQRLCFTRRIRGQRYDARMTPQARRVPTLLAIGALRDLPPAALMLAAGAMRARDPMNLTGQLLLALALLLSVALALNYCMAEYLMIDHPGLGPVAALRASRRRLSGRRFELFLLAVSFSGWFLLAALTPLLLSAAPPWVIRLALFLALVPLMTWVWMAQAVFFETLSGKMRIRKTRNAI